MKIRNRVQLIGNLGADPKIKKLDNGSTMATFSLATSESYHNNKGERITETQWHNIVAFGKTAEIIELYLKKGNEVALEGKLTHRQYEDNAGIKRFYTEVVVYEMLMLGKPKNETVPTKDQVVQM